MKSLILLSEFTNQSPSIFHIEDQGVSLQFVPTFVLDRFAVLHKGPNERAVILQSQRDGAVSLGLRLPIADELRRRRSRRLGGEGLWRGRSFRGIRAAGIFRCLRLCKQLQQLL